MLRASRILPKLERAGGGGDCFRFFMFPLKNDRDEIVIIVELRTRGGRRCVTRGLNIRGGNDGVSLSRSAAWNK